MDKESAVDRKTKQISYLLHPPLNEVQAAEFLGYSTQTMRNKRHLGEPPVYVKLSPGPRGAVRYLLEDLMAYRQQCRVYPEEV